MSQDVQIVIRINDQGASATFQRLGSSAQAMASSIEQAGGKGAAGLQKLETSAQKSATAFEKLSRSGAAIGGALTTVSGLLSDAARAAADAEARMARLETAVNNTGASFDELAPSIDAALQGAEQLAFDGEKAADALATLTSFTGDANEALDLLGLTMDIARARGVDLATAATAVGKAAEGNVGALTRMGVAVREGASAQEALAAAQQTFAGQAEAYANTSQGAFDRVAVSIGNLYEAVGQNLGPLQTILGILPGVSAGFTMLGGAVGGTVGVLRNSQIAMAAMAAGAGPLAIAIAGVAVAGVALYKAFENQAAQFDEISGAADRLGNSLSTVSTEYTVTQLQSILLTADDVKQGLAELSDLSLYEAMDLESANRFNAALERTGKAAADANQPVGELAMVGLQLKDAIGNGLTIDQATMALEDYGSILAHTGPGAEMAAANVHALNLAFQAGLITPQQWAQGLAETNAQIGYFDRLATEATQSAYAFSAGQQAVNNAVLETGAAYDKYSGFAESAAAADERKAEATRALVAEFQALIPAMDGVIGRFQELVQPGEDIIDVLDRFAGAANAPLALADNLMDAGAALQGTLGAFEQLGALADPINAAADAAEQLIAPLGEVGAAEEWLTRTAEAINAGGTALGLFGTNLTTVAAASADYNAVLGAQVQLEESRAEANRLVTEMQMGMLPLMAAQAQSYTEQLAALRELTPAEQQRALYLMDSANAAQLASIASTAYSAALGEIPAEVGTDIIANAAAADPVLAGILEDLGYIEQGADGTITVTLPDASQLALDKFEAMFGEGNVEKTASGFIEVTDAEGNTYVYDQFNNLVDKQVTATVTIDLNDPNQVLSRGGGGAAANSVNAMAMDLENTEITVGITADSTEFDRILADAQAAAEAWRNEQYVTSIEATDDASSVIAEAEGNATAYATGTYNAPIEATDNASAVVTEIQILATTYAEGTYSGELTAEDRASATIQAVQSAIAQLNGQRATVYVDVVQNAPVPSGGGGGQRTARMLGGAIPLDVPRAALGRTVMVGEAGPELVTLPYGSMVSPTGASMSRQRAQGGVPGDPEAAYASGQASGAAYWRGLLDENRRKLEEINRTLGEVFDTREEAQAALRRFDDLSRARDELRDRYRRARQVERDAEKDAGRAIGTALAEGVSNAAESIDEDFEDIAELFDDLITDFDDQWGKWKPKKKDLELDKRKGKRELDDLIDDIRRGFENKTFTTSLAANDRKAKDDLSSAISHVETKWTAPSVTWNTTLGASYDELKIDINAAGGYAESNWAGGNYNTSLGGNDKAVRDAIDGLVGNNGWLRNNWFGKNFDTGLGGDDGAVRNAVNNLTGAGGWLRNNWFGTNYNTGLGGDDNPVRNAVNNLTGSGGWLRTNWFGTSFTTNLAGDPQGVKNDVNGLIGNGGWLRDNWTGQTFRANMRMQDRSVNDIIDDVQSSLRGAGFSFNSNRQLWNLRWRNDQQGMVTGGTVQAMPRAELGRAVVVGEAGPEVAVLPYGTMVQPTGASRSRMAAEGRDTVLNVYGAVHVHAATPDIAREISRQLQSQGRA